eukprot:7172355-Alexandrium_andersonii.AAC.1
MPGDCQTHPGFLKRCNVNGVRRRAPHRRAISNGNERQLGRLSAAKPGRARTVEPPARTPKAHEGTWTRGAWAPWERNRAW